MVPTWMIEDIERWRGDREECDQPRIELPRPPVDDGARPPPSRGVVIESGMPDRRAPADPFVIDTTAGSWPAKGARRNGR